MNEEEINYELIEELIMKIGRDYEEGGILVFLPGLMEITTLYEQLLSNRYVPPPARPRRPRSTIRTHAYARTHARAQRDEGQEALLGAAAALDAVHRATAGHFLPPAEGRA